MSGTVELHWAAGPVSIADQRAALKRAIEAARRFYESQVVAHNADAEKCADDLAAMNIAVVTFDQVQPLLDCIQSLRDALLLEVARPTALHRCEIADALLHRLYQLNGGKQ